MKIFSKIFAYLGLTQKQSMQNNLSNNGSVILQGSAETAKKRLKSERLHHRNSEIETLKKKMYETMCKESDGFEIDNISVELVERDSEKSRVNITIESTVRSLHTLENQQNKSEVLTTVGLKESTSSLKHTPDSDGYKIRNASTERIAGQDELLSPAFAMKYSINEKRHRNNINMHKSSAIDFLSI